MTAFLRRDRQYKPLPIFVLDPLEYTAMGLHILKGMNGESRWEQCQKARFKHPDPQKTACVLNGAIIYTALFPDRTHKGHRPPEAWLREVGVTEASLAEARAALELDDPNWGQKIELRREINEIMDKAIPETKQ